MKKWNFFCCIKDCEKIRNGSSKYCAKHQAESQYKLQNVETKKTGVKWRELWNKLRKENAERKENQKV